tara:strand:+ start:273 stop:647 length:375 start_codon:yes stop_codon:yes gene_type:complete
MSNKEIEMSKFKVYQIQLTKAEIEMINTNGHNSVPKQKMRLDISMPVGEPIAAMAKEALAADYYTHVANIEAYSLEDVFECGNIGPEKNIERLDRMSSLSVGDVVEDEYGIRHVVASFGFEEVA